MSDWSHRIDGITREFSDTFGALTPEQLNWKPDGKSWSIAQVLDHLIIISKSYYPTLDALETGTHKPPFTAKIGLLTSLFGKLVLGGVQPNRKRKVKTFLIWEPRSSDLPDNILEQFRQHQEELKVRMQKSEPFVQTGTAISSPANKYIVYTLETAFDIIVTHEQRHCEQAKEVLELMKTQGEF